MSLYQTFFDLTRLQMHLWDRVDKALRQQCGVTLARVEALLVVLRLGTCRVQDISRELSVTVGGTSKLIDRLEASGYCTRTPNPEDGRSSLVALTPAAAPLAERAQTVIERELQSALGDHTIDEELQQLGRQVGRLRRLLNDA